MTSEYVQGREAGAGSAQAGGEGTGGGLRRLVHAVLRRDADGPPPWTAACGAQVAEVRGNWDPERQLGWAEAACPACLSRLAA
jgi:hypothetical protein